MDALELKGTLSQYTGTEQWYRHFFNKNFLYTDGVKHFAENAGNGAYWFLDIMATEFTKLQAENPFMSVHLNVQGSEAVLELTDGNDGILAGKRIEFTDCPEGNWNFYLIDNVMLLPSEY
ncbi:hypothetical protein UFOVP26_32 [uncultured Caudovirales phage]|uniref:DUF6876 domain-containing protein n=1 Tax=uncultured Caudovirales phage TaxID=2100421 RepID=A0A6J5KKL0_9CAUD|nr:hypothetical protein UFOVP26_32 [uncultured Caudovirales phage]CAB4123837.1 hypothetical protein UFOVP44_65 [uncultured Caudovirales phage]CAB5219274.1 hypothetical protein UFOVP220_56 [uncultured Caudovirales phage]